MSSRLILRKGAVLVLAAIVLFLPGRPAAEEGDGQEVVRGTVAKYKPGIIYLTNVSFQDENIAPRDIMVLVSKDTAYFDGPRRVTKEEIEPGMVVLVRCEPAGTGRKGLLVRIIGKKPQ